MAEADFTPTPAADYPDYHQTQQELRRWERLDRALNAYNVTYWQVVEDRVMSDGRKCSGVPLSPMFCTKQECRKAYAEIKSKRPRAYRMKGTRFFHWLRPEDIAARASILRKMRHGIA